MVSVLCAICLNTTEYSQLVAVQRCGHVFHSNCLNKWLNTKCLRHCPTCRTPIFKYYQIFIHFEHHWDDEKLKSALDEQNRLIETLRSDVNKLSDKFTELESKNVSTANALDLMEKKAEELRKLRKLNRDQEKQVTHLKKELSSANKEAKQYRVLKKVLDVKLVEMKPQTDLESANLIIKSLKDVLIKSLKKNNQLAPLKDLSLNEPRTSVDHRYNTRLSARNSSKSAGKEKPIDSNNAGPEKENQKRKAVSDHDDNANGGAEETGGAAKRFRKNVNEFVDKI